MTARAYWVGWEVPYDIPEEAKVEKWPEGMLGFNSGHGGHYSTWVGIVFGDNAAAAWKTVLDCYGDHAGDIVERFGPDECQDGWKPSDRWIGAEEWYAQELAKRAK